MSDPPPRIHSSSTTTTTPGSSNVVVRTFFFAALLLSVITNFKDPDFAYNSVADAVEFVMDYANADGTNTLLPRLNETETEIETESSNVTNNVMNTKTKRYARKRLPTLDELTSIPANSTYPCPEGTEVFENIVLPMTITHEGRNIPRVVHMTAKTRCVTPEIKKHILQWKFPNHSLYFHDDDAVFKLLEYAVDDARGHELIRHLKDTVLCISSGATMTDIWRHLVLYYYGGIYTDFDNAPGTQYDVNFIEPQTDAFFFREQMGSPSQYYLAASKHHPILLHILSAACSHESLYKTSNNVMRNNPATNTGPRAVKIGMIRFLMTYPQKHWDGYVPAGIYQGGVGPNLTKLLPWYGSDDPEYPSPTELEHRSATVVGIKQHHDQYIDRQGMNDTHKSQAWETMNMTHYQNQKFPRHNKISCWQHVARMKALTTNNESSVYFGKTKIADLLPKYEFNHEAEHWFDTRTNEMMVPWNGTERRQAEADDLREEQ